MFVIYDLIFLLIAIVYLPMYLLRRKFHRGFFLRLGFLPKDLTLDRPMWLHAVSVGEVMSVRNLIDELRKGFPNKELVISTVTPTGNKIAKDIALRSDFVTYLPLDLSFIVGQVIEKIKPSIFIIAETEIWPNLISYLHKKKIPIIVVNGRISDSSFKGYLATNFLLRSIFNKINLFCVQTNQDAERFKALGVANEKIKVTGNMKFDLKIDNQRQSQDYRMKLGLGSKETLLVAASTHAGEEEIILKIYKDLLRDYADLRLLIAPRHPERALKIERLIKNHNFSSLRISQANLSPTTYNLPPVFILDTVGQLMDYYAISDIVFVGGSLIKKGGHNILEPASLGKPILFGPYMFNFRDLLEIFLENQAAILIQDKNELKENIKYLLEHPAKMNEIGQCAKSLLINNDSATRKNIALIKSLYADTSL